MKALKLMCGAGVLSMMFLAPAFATDPPAQATPGHEMRLLSGGNRMTATVVVKAIDLPNRVVTVTTEDGEDEVMQISDQARNLAQLKVGDRVVLTYKVALAVSLAPASAADSEPAGETGTMNRTALGEKPGGSLHRTVRAEATVTSIDPNTRLVTLQGPKQTFIVKAAPKVDLAKVKVGDSVRAVYEQSLAIKVEPAPSTGGK